MAGRGQKCPNCNKYAGVIDKGVTTCGKCRAIWWSPFDRPAAGRPRRGFTCINCGQMKMHPVGVIENTEAWRCSVCGATLLCVPQQ